VNHAGKECTIRICILVAFGLGLVREEKERAFKLARGRRHTTKYMHSVLYELPPLPFAPSSSGAGKMKAGDGNHGQRGVNIWEMRRESGIEDREATY
jgi:hypothetical protein